MGTRIVRSFIQSMYRTCNLIDGRRILSFENIYLLLQVNPSLVQQRKHLLSLYFKKMFITL